jgi:hypothetical protein
MRVSSSLQLQMCLYHPEPLVLPIALRTIFPITKPPRSNDIEQCLAPLMSTYL